MANKVDVVICGEVITLKSDEDEAHLQRIARYIDRKLAELTATNANASINERIRTLLIALNVADDYFKASDGLARTKAMQEKYVNELARMQKEYTLLKERFHELQGELTHTKAELESFVTEYDNNFPREGINVLTLPRENKRKVTVR